MREMMKMSEVRDIGSGIGMANATAAQTAHTTLACTICALACVGCI